MNISVTTLSARASLHGESLQPFRPDLQKFGEGRPQRRLGEVGEVDDGVVRVIDLPFRQGLQVGDVVGDIPLLHGHVVDLRPREGGQVFDGDGDDLAFPAEIHHLPKRFLALPRQADDEVGGHLDPRLYRLGHGKLDLLHLRRLVRQVKDRLVH